MEKTFKVMRASNGNGDSNLLVIIDDAVVDIHIGTVLLVPYVKGYIDPSKVLIYVNEDGSPKLANKKFVIVSEYIYE